MAYGSYLVKFGDYEIPLSYIRAETYSITKNGQDLDSYRDGDGILHRNALSHFVWKVEFETKPLLTEDEKETLMSNIRANYTSATEKCGTMTAFDPESGDYISQQVYIPDIPFTIFGIFDGEVKYNSFRIAFIGY